MTFFIKSSLNKHIRFSTFLFFLLSNTIYGQNFGKLSAEITKLKNDNTLKNGIWSVCVMNTKTDSVLVQNNSNISLMPASTMKIVTTATALSLLGSDFTFETKLMYDGVIDNKTGVLIGNLYIIGGGDPTLESEYFKSKEDSISIVEQWAIIIKSKGIKKIEGAVIGDATAFAENSVPRQWIWEDIGNYYGASACALTYRDNKYSVYLNSGSEGSATTIAKMSPEIKNIELINFVIAKGKEDSAFIFGAPYTNYRSIEGSIPANKTNFKIEGSLPDPALLCAQELEIALKKKDVLVTKNATTMRIIKGKKNAEQAKQLLYTRHSPSLDKIVYWTNIKSLNLFAENLIYYLAYKKTGFGTEEKGIDVIKKHLQEKGIDESGFFMSDGSGLARANAITTKTQTQVLRMMANDKNFKSFYESLPIAGKSGSLEAMCKNTFAENNLRAKSGYITRARAYAGYAKNRKGEMLCFSVIANNYNCSPTEIKRKLEKILIAIAESE